MSRPIPVWLVAVTATALALAIWVLAVPVAGLDLVAGTPPQTVGAVSVVVATLVVTLAAWGVRTLLRRRSTAAWWLTCTIVLALSLLGPLGGASPAATGTLAAMHLGVGAVIAVGLDPRRARVRTPAMAG
jgi:purine-cytosine permease-like protein